MIGQTLGHYRVIEQIGAGGMGLVFRAHDERLERDVALKILPPGTLTDENARQRFRKEALTLSKLNHPNIATVFDFDTQDGVDFLVMELIPGVTLDEKLAAGALPEKEVIRFGAQLAEALAAAHAEGVIHRDLKPGNLRLMPDRRLKVLDFGLAKLLQPIAPDAATESLSKTHGVVGTMPYMSPEQLRGGSAEARGDIWAAGAVLYEMATGHRAFPQKSSPLLTDAILHQPPQPPRELKHDISPGLENIIFKALDKDPEYRYQSAPELLVDLERLSAPGAQAPVGAARRARPGRRLLKPTPILAALGMALLLVASFGAYHYWPTSDTSRASSGARGITRVSHWNKAMNSAKLSPDGHAVAFNSPVEDVQQIFVMLTSGGDPLQLTHDDGDKYVNSFSPDGTEIYYQRFLGGDEVWVKPTLGGPPRRVVSGRSLRTSPDGRSYFYLKSYSKAIFQADKSGLNEKQIYDFETLAFTPTGELLPFPDGNDLLVTAVPRQSSQDVRHLFKLNVTSHTATELGTISGSPSGLAWAEPGETVLLSRTVDGLTNLWKYDLTNRRLARVTSGAGPDYTPMLDPATRGIYYVNGKAAGSLAAYHPLRKKSVVIVSEDASGPMLSRDGKRVIYLKVLGPDKTELWVSHVDGAGKLKLASSTALGTGEWSPDGSQVGFYDMAGGTTRTYSISTEGRSLREIERVAGDVVWIIWSHDGKSLYLSSRPVGTRPTVWKANADGSHAEKFVDACYVTDASADGKYLLGFVPYGEAAGIYEISLADKKVIQLLPGVATSNARFAADGKSVLYALALDGRVTFYRQAWAAGKMIGKPQVALRLPFGLPLVYEGQNGFDFSRDLSTIVYPRPGRQDDLYLLGQSQ